MEQAKNFKRIRKEKKLTQEKFAETLGVDFSTINRIENSKFNPSYSLIEKIKEYCLDNDIVFDPYDESIKLQLKGSEDIIVDLNKIISESYSMANKAVNYLLIQRNWLVGRRINEEILSNRKDDYGQKLIKELASLLTEKFGKGFDCRNLYYYVDFYNKFPNILEEENSKTLLTWTHYRNLLRVEDDKARKWYTKEASKESWSVRTLQRNISSQYYERIISTKCKKKVHDEMVLLNTKNQRDPKDYIKDPMILEFLNIAEDNTYMESDLEKAILNHLQQFIMELGKGYAFVARQKRIHTEKCDYFIDLVFYNYILKCFVLIDLKTSKITHQDVGQMDMYIRMFDETVKDDNDNPTLGIVLCSETDEDIAKYSIMHGSEQLFASKYKLYLPDEEILKREIENQKEFQKLKNDK